MYLYSLYTVYILCIEGKGELPKLQSYSQSVLNTVPARVIVLIQEIFGIVIIENIVELYTFVQTSLAVTDVYSFADMQIYEFIHLRVIYLYI